MPGVARGLHLILNRAGLVKLGHVAIDGTKLQGNASKQSPRRPMSYGRMGEAEQKLKDEIDALLKRAEAEDAAEEEKFGKGRSGDCLRAVVSQAPRSRSGTRQSFPTPEEGSQVAADWPEIRSSIVKKQQCKVLQD
jgi:hypothetical protein